MASGVLGEDFGAFGAAFGLVVAGVASYFIGRPLNAPVRGYHPRTGRPVVYQDRHTFFFVPMQYWGFILIGGAVIAGMVGIATQLGL